MKILRYSFERETKPVGVSHVTEIGKFKFGMYIYICICNVCWTLQTYYGQTNWRINSFQHANFFLFGVSLIRAICENVGIHTCMTYDIVFAICGRIVVREWRSSQCREHSHCRGKLNILWVELRIFSYLLAFFSNEICTRLQPDCHKLTVSEDPRLYREYVLLLSLPPSPLLRFSCEPPLGSL